jgi:hypothetical protein
MNRNLLLCLLSILCGAFLSGAGAAVRPQEVFEDPEGKYSLTLPKGWHAITSRDGLGRAQVDIVYQVREYGALKIRRIEVEKGTKALEQARREEQSLNFSLPGYAKGSIENFGAGVDAALLSYSFTNSGRPMIGRNYYLLVNETTIYLLRFTGSTNTLSPLRNQTDTIARSFKAR